MDAVIQQASAKVRWLRAEGIQRTAPFLILQMVQIWYSRGFLRVAFSSLRPPLEGYRLLYSLMETDRQSKSAHRVFVLAWD